MANYCRDRRVAFAEWNPAADEEVGEVGRRDHRVGGCVVHRVAVEFRSVQHPVGGCERQLEVVDAVEEVVLVLLHVLVVSEWQSMHNAVKPS